MKAKRKVINFKLHQLFIAAMAAVLVGIMVLNVVLMYDIAAQQTEEIGRMRVQSITAGFQKSLTRAEYSLERVCNSLEEMLQNGAAEAEIRHFLSEQKNIEYGLSDGVCQNVFCVIDGVVMISDMDTPDDYVLQDRVWYRRLMATKRGEICISPTYEDAFTDDMCFTVAIMLEDGETVVALDYSLAEIQSYIDEMGGDEYGDAMIVDANEVIVGYTDPDMIGKKLSSALPQYRDAFLRAVASGEESLSLKTSTDGEDSTIFCSKTENGWYMMCSVSNSALYRENYRQLLRNFCIVLLLVFVIVIVYFLGLRERRRAEFVLRGMDEIHTEDKKEKKQIDLTVRDQRKYQIGITSIFIVTMFIAITGSASMSINESRIKMEDELRGYNYEVGDWILEQKSILDMFNNVVAAKPELLLNYDQMVKFLDDITKHYPKISATYIANPDFPHGHPMVMNNGWVPEPDYVEEERIWYIGALTAEDFNITEPYYDARTGEYCITFSKVVKSDSGEFYGVFAIDFYLDVLMEILGESYSEQGYAFLVDKNGLIIDHPNSDYEFSDEDSVNIHELVYDRLYSETGMVVLKDYDDEYKVCASMDENVSGFRIVVVKDWWSIYGNVCQYAVLFLGLFGGCIIAVNVVINRMIQWQSRANDNLKEAAESAIRAEQAKSRFLSNMSHEIRTPINAVLGMNEMIMRECKDEQLLSYAVNIQNSGRTLLFLINDILDMSKIESGKMEIVPSEYEMADVITDLWNGIYLRAHEKSLKIDFLLDETMPGTLFGDDVRIKQIVTNLLTNAVKYTPKGSIEMHASYRRTGGDMVDLIISVKDTGMGIKQEDMGKLFESFQRIDEEKNRNIEGTGLGMNITMSLLKLMGGDMKVESEYQKGSTFTVTIPQKVINDEPTGDFERVMSRQRSGEIQKQESFEAPDASILVVDDNAMNLTVFKSLLKRTKMNIVTADSGRKCLELVKKEHFDIIFMDHMMPEMDGIETLHEIQKMSGFPNEGTPVIVLTANALSGAREGYLKEGFVDFLTKPIDVELLESAVANFLPKDLIKIKAADVQDTKEETTNAKIDYERFLQYGISIENGLSLAKGDMEFYLEIVEIFIKEHKNQDDIKSFMEEGNMKDYAVQVHGLKGNARTLGADKLADISYEHEMKSKAGDTEYVSAHWDELVSVWDETYEGFMEFYDRYGHSGDKYGMVSADGKEVLHLSKDDLDKVAALLDDFETKQAIGKLKEWISQPLEQEMYALIRDVLIALEDEINEEKAIELLKNA